MQHTPSHWIAVVLVLVALLLALNEAHGQSAGGAAAFEGRPALAGAQGGLGSQAGPPQGGIGVQGSEDAQRSVHLRRPANVTNMPQGTPDTKGDLAAARNAVRNPKDTSIARDEQSALKKAKRAAKRTVRRASAGVGEIDSKAAAAR
jgi:hypothetical protein